MGAFERAWGHGVVVCAWSCASRVLWLWFMLYPCSSQVAHLVMLAVRTTVWSVPCGGGAWCERSRWGVS